MPSKRYKIKISKVLSKDSFYTRNSECFYTFLITIALVLLALLQNNAVIGVSDETDGFNLFGQVDSPSHYLLSRKNRESPLRVEDLVAVEELVPKNYNIHEPPTNSNGRPVKVEFYVLIVGIQDISEIHEQMTLEMNMQMYWRDDRLAHLADKAGNNFIVLNPSLLTQLWHPDIYIDHVKKIDQPKLLSTPASLRIYPDNTVRYSSRLTIQMACRWDFHYYPADTQRCDIDMKSYGYSDKVLVLDWREGRLASLKKGIILPSFEVGLGNTLNFSQQASSATYSAIRFTILLRRNISFHLLQTYFPSALFVFISFLSFLVSPESIPGRMTLCMTTLLTITAMFAAVRQITPNVSYVKGIDIWMVSCIITVFMTLVEYTLLLKLRNIKPKKKNKKQSHGIEEDGISNPSFSPDSPDSSRGIFKLKILKKLGLSKSRDELNISSSPHLNLSNNGNLDLSPYNSPHSSSGNNMDKNRLERKSTIEIKKEKHETISMKIERIFSKVIPSLFIAFNLFYWPWLFTSADYFNYEEFIKTRYAD